MLKVHAEPARDLRTTASDALAQILADHREIRHLLGIALDLAYRAADGRRMDPVVLPQALEGVASVLDQHLAREERLLLPILEDDPPVGPLRATALREEHGRQRIEIARLVRGCWEKSQMELAADLRRLIQDFLIDMAEEEEVLLTSSVVRDDIVAIDQATD